VLDDCHAVLVAAQPQNSVGEKSPNLLISSMRSGGALTLFIGCLPPSLVRSYRGGPKPNSRACAKTAPACSRRQPCCACSERGLQLKYWGTPPISPGGYAEMFFSVMSMVRLGQRRMSVRPIPPTCSFIVHPPLKALTDIYPLSRDGSNLCLLVLSFQSKFEFPLIFECSTNLDSFFITRSRR
jgi:hypothetical protein